ncbi:MAG: phosphatase PAP2 family protein [Verrucomicrobiota bacterium]
MPAPDLTLLGFLFASLWSPPPAPDAELVRAINGSHAPWADVALAVVSSQKLLIGPAALAALMAFWLGSFRVRSFLVLSLVCVVITDIAVVRVTKELAGRPRPYQALEGTRLVTLSGVEITEADDLQTRGVSFFSGHTFDNAVVATIAAVFFGSRSWLTWVAWAWVALMGYSRIYLGMHYPSDVLAGAASAVVSALLFLLLAQRLWARYAPRLAPQLAAAHPELVWRKRPQRVAEYEDDFPDRIYLTFPPKQNLQVAIEKSDVIDELMKNQKIGYCYGTFSDYDDSVEYILLHVDLQKLDGDSFCRSLIDQGLVPENIRVEYVTHTT